MSHHLKVLSGALSGIEYALSEGDTVFHVGSQQDMGDGTASALLAAADNVYFLPADLPSAAFVVQCPAQGAQRYRLGERRDSSRPWQYRDVDSQQVVMVGGLHIALKPHDVTWSDAVTGFRPDALPTLPGAESPRSRHAPASVLAALLLVVGVGAASAWLWRQYSPEHRARGLASVLQDAPSSYQVLAAGRDGLYVFSDSAAAQSWGERASRRLRREGDHYLVRADEARRLEGILVQHGMPTVVVRLENPTAPQVVLSGKAGEDVSPRVLRVLRAAAPYVTSPVVSFISDDALVRIAQDSLRRRGISSRTEPGGHRLSVINDAFLDDAAVNAMSRTATEFHHQWGNRRISIQIQQWDDLLKGQSYQYSQGQLTSVGNSRWKFARAIH